MNARKATTYLALTAALMALGSTAWAAKPTPHQLSLAASPTKVVYGGSTTLLGRLTGKNNAGQAITVQQDPYPFGTFVSLGKVVARADGTYSFVATPKVNTRYRTNAKTKSPATSPTVLVLVAPRVSRHVSDTTPTAGQKVRFYGRVTPVHGGQLVYVQRRRKDGTWGNVAQATLVDDAGGAFSKYSVKVKVRRSAVYRVSKPADLDHARG